MTSGVVKTDRGWVDLSNLVYNKKMVNWDESVGKTVDFQYDDVIATLIVTGRADDNQYVYIDIPGYVEHFRIYVGQIRHGQLGSAVKKITKDFKYEIGDVVNGLLITGKYRTPGYKHYNYCCVEDGYVSTIREDHLMKNHGCPVCAGKQVLKGYNDIATTRPDLVDLFYDKNDAFIYAEHSNKYTYFKCPRCGNIIYAYIADVSNRGLSCKKCGDGISYANKFVYNLVEQIAKLYALNEKRLTFKPEKKFEWSLNFEHPNKKLSGDKIYDMYLYEQNIIIENHGNYHYTNGFQKINGARSLEEVQENDKIKHNLAISNGVKDDHYIVLNCYEPNMYYIKNSVMSSNMPILLSFTENDIDWAECDKFATSSRVYEACVYWNNGVKDYEEIASNMHMHKDTIKRYIRKGRKLGIVTM